MNDCNAIPVARGCGTRGAGGIYIECGLGPFGAPLENFICDAPTIVDLDELGLSKVGTKLIERAGVWHVFDYVGSTYYPNVADFLEEVRRFGLSRRIAGNTDFSKLTAASRIVLVHGRAHVDNFAEYAEAWRFLDEPSEGHPAPRCPKHIKTHDQEEAPAMCAGVWWQDVEDDDAAAEPVLGTSDQRRLVRQLPSFFYTAYRRPAGVEPQYRPAIFATFPITRLVGVRSTGVENEKMRGKLSKANVATALVDN